MDKGRVRVGLTMVGSFIRASHGVEPDQLEPGVDLQDQPAEHALDIGVLQWNLDAQLGVHRRFAVELLLPIRATIINATFRDRSGNVRDDFSSIHHRDETISGLGDIVVGGRIGLVLPDDVPRWTLALRTGASLPTGNTEPDPFVLGERGETHQHMFFGSGTVDPVFGLDTNIAFDRWSLVGWAVTRTPLYSNQYGYRRGHAFIGGVGAQSGFGLERWSFLIQPEWFFETPARWRDTAARNSGRLSLLATGGIVFMPAPGWQVQLLAKIPYFTRAQGGQLRWPFVAMLGFNYTFDLAPPDAE
ncbi:MAG: transporter [Deltaproteobacteria bacterium]|nr:transporter [Deltaproteobacteria bacterium]